MSGVDWIIVQHFFIFPGQKKFPCPTDFGLGHMDCFDQWNVGRRANILVKRRTSEIIVCFCLTSATLVICHGEIFYLASGPKGRWRPCADLSSTHGLEAGSTVHHLKPDDCSLASQTAVPLWTREHGKKEMPL